LSALLLNYYATGVYDREQPVEVRVIFRWSKEFKLDLAHEGIDEARFELLRRNIASNPFIGRPVPGDAHTRHYEFGRQVVTFRVSDTRLAKGEILVWLLRMTPKEKPPPMLTERASRAIDAYFKIKKVIREIFWKGDDE
jgi:hypothetical protein